MSASSKKKLRKELAAAALTEKQQAEKKEAKKLKVYTLTFWVALALCVCIVLGIALSGPVNGLLNRAITAITVGEHKINAVELNYYYIDAINEYCNTYSSIISYMLDMSKPLDKQIVDEESGTTWADNFVEMAVTNAKSTYALCDAAKAAGYKLSEDEQKSVDAMISNLEIYAMYYQHDSADSYVAAIYGKGATAESYRDYFEMSTLASSYYQHYSDELKYEDADLRAREKDKYYEFSSYTFASYYVKVESFLTGGTKGEDGKTTYSDAEKKAAEELAKKAAEGLAIEKNNTVEKLDKAIKALSINKDNKTAASTKSVDTLYSKVSVNYNEWLRDEARKEGDITCIPYETTSKDADGKEVKTVAGYYVVLFQECNDNTYALANVRHILVPFQGGKTDTNGNTTYSDAEKMAAKDKAYALLDEWYFGDATEEKFAEMAKKHSTDTGSKEEGGLYEAVVPGQMVTNFNDWCFDDKREVGDSGVVESTYGYHVMFYSGDNETNYRDYMIEEDLRKTDVEKWYNGLLDAVTVSEKNTNRVDSDMILSKG